MFIAIIKIIEFEAISLKEYLNYSNPYYVPITDPLNYPNTDTM